MKIIYTNWSALRPKVSDRINGYLALSEHNSLTLGIYKNGRLYVFGDSVGAELFYDVGSVTKTLTAHLILKLSENGVLDINKKADEYLPLKKGKYPTLYQLLTHTSGYHHLTPVEITLPPLALHGYARKNPYEDCSVKTVIKALERRRHITPRVRYGYSDFAYAILASVAEAVTKTPFSDLLEEFIKTELGMQSTHIELPAEKRYPPAANGKKILPYWVWKRDNPYIAGGGVVSNIEDILKYIALEIESEKPYITKAHAVCKSSETKGNHLMCIGWHTYKRSNQLWHVGGVGTFRSSIIVNRQKRMGVAVLGNAKGKASANAHYIAKMLYSELKNKRIKLSF
ncbi:MAG: beta-lactamase family protein [Clostridia bacterium]|nr:beta-lactamase family protein [Clostridia bacterium]